MSHEWHHYSSIYYFSHWVLFCSLSLHHWKHLILLNVVAATALQQQFHKEGESTEQLSHRFLYVPEVKIWLNILVTCMFIYMVSLLVCSSIWYPFCNKTKLKCPPWQLCKAYSDRLFLHWNLSENKCGNVTELIRWGVGFVLVFFKFSKKLETNEM